MAANKKMTEAQTQEYTTKMQDAISELLGQIQNVLPPGYAITFVARHMTVSDAQLILSKDSDIEAVARLLLNAKN